MDAQTWMQTSAAMDATKQTRMQTSTAMGTTSKTWWHTQTSPAIMAAAMMPNFDSNNHDGASVTSMRSGFKGKRQELGESNQMTHDSDDADGETKQREQKMKVGGHYKCAAYHDTGCQAQWSGSHPWWAYGKKNGKDLFICSECQFKLYGWITHPSSESRRILRASAPSPSTLQAASSSSANAGAVDAASIPVPMDIDDDL